MTFFCECTTYQTDKIIVAQAWFPRPDSSAIMMNYRYAKYNFNKKCSFSIQHGHFNFARMCLL